MAIEQNKKAVNFGGWSTTDKLINWDQVFDVEYNDDGEIYLVTKKTYKHDEPESELVFEYKYFVNAIDMLMRSGEPDYNFILLYLHMFPLPKCWAEKNIKDAARLNGWEDMPREELLSYLNSQDAVQNGCYVKMLEDKVEYEIEDEDDDDAGFYDILDNEQVVEKINMIATIIDTVDSLRGFSLDQAWNPIGTTGWDSLYDILQGKDAIQATMERYKEAMANSQ